jgi:xylulokinase
MYIGIDLGTSSVKVILVDSLGSVLKKVTRKYPIYNEYPLWSEQKPLDWYKETVAALYEITREHSNIRGISFSGQMHGLVILGKNDEVLRNCILWNDQRSYKEVAYLNNVIGIKKLSSFVGNRALSGFTGPKLLWLNKNEPIIFNKIEKIMLPKDYLVYRLCNEFVTDVSDASGTLFFDVKNRKWSAEMMEIFGINENQLPHVYESSDIVGHLKKDIKEQLNLNNDVKIIIGGGDQACSAVGTNTLKKGDCSISLGTSGVVFAPSKNFKVDNNNSLHSFAHANGNYHLMGVTLSAAGSLEWWKEKINPSIEFEELFSNIEKTDIHNQLYFLPYLSGERTPINDSVAKGIFLGLQTNTTSKDMLRAILEGVCYSFLDVVKEMKKINIIPKKIRITGGGSNNNFWVQMLSDVLNIEIVKTELNEGGAMGAAILAMVGCKEFDNVFEASNSIVVDKQSFTPNIAKNKVYSNKYLMYKKIYDANKVIFQLL